jgi:L-alanine-DL-glutamate epimerase-like enolase superfamily enzyme
LDTDESIRTPQDVIGYVEAVDGVVNNLMRSGGIYPALLIIEVARSVDMHVMLNCMVESSVVVTAAAHLASLCEYVDLDVLLFIKDDPYPGVI